MQHGQPNFILKLPCCFRRCHRSPKLIKYLDIILDIKPCGDSPRTYMPVRFIYFKKLSSWRQEIAFGLSRCPLFMSFSMCSNPVNSNLHWKQKSPLKFPAQSGRGWNIDMRTMWLLQLKSMESLSKKDVSKKDASMKNVSKKDLPVLSAEKDISWHEICFKYLSPLGTLFIIIMIIIASWPECRPEFPSDGGGGVPTTPHIWRSPGPQVVACSNSHNDYLPKHRLPFWKSLVLIESAASQIQMDVKTPKQDDSCMCARIENHYMLLKNRLPPNWTIKNETPHLQGPHSAQMCFSSVTNMGLKTNCMARHGLPGFKTSGLNMPAYHWHRQFDNFKHSLVNQLRQSPYQPLVQQRVRSMMFGPCSPNLPPIIDFSKVLQWEEEEPHSNLESFDFRIT